MLAVRIHQYGKRDALSLDDIPVPEIAPDELLVGVAASGRAVGRIALYVGLP
jgi:NADPH:quinone reductase-like Zn-dependent oxidoreductase